MISQSQAAQYAYQAGFTGPALNLIVGASTAQGEKGLNTLADFQKAFQQTSGGTNLAAIPEFRTGTAQAQTYDWWAIIQQGLSVAASNAVNNPGTVIQSANLNPIDSITSFIKGLAIPTGFVIIGIIVALVGLFLIIMTPQHVQTIKNVAKDAAAGAALAA
jgi:hypothetical protein